MKQQIFWLPIDKHAFHDHIGALILLGYDWDAEVRDGKPSPDIFVTEGEISKIGIVTWELDN